MPTKTRTFVAIELSGPVRERIAKVQEHLKPKAPGIRWIEPRNLHVTLAFLGEVLDVDLRDVCRAVQGAVAALPRLQLEVKGFGAFPPSGRPRVVWVGVEGKDLPALQTMQRAVASSTRAAGYPPTDARFHAHVSIGRIDTRDAPLPDLEPLVKPFALWTAGTLDVKRVAVFSSILQREGPSYALLAEAPLGRVQRGPDAPRSGG